jgi:dTDP-4-amino-4,6-dideoxygalactose transaminase
VQECFRHLDYHAGDLPVSERVCREMLALPMFPDLSHEQQRQVVLALQQFVA